MKFVAALAGAGLVLILGVAVVVGGPDATSPPSERALEETPADLLTVYVAAASTCQGLPWQVLAAIGYFESRHAQGRTNPASGDVDPPILGIALDGTNGTEMIRDPSSPDGWAHALGPMQFLPSTWKRWGRLAPGRPLSAKPSPHNSWDAIYSAAAYLCGGRPRLDDLEAAIYSYSHSHQYVSQVIAKAGEYGLGAGGGAPVVIVDGMACPVTGPVQFENDWGDPRSGGRTHKGTDMFAPHGTPLVAIENGVIDSTLNVDQGLGGISIWLRGDSGTTYYYAHNTANAVVPSQRVRAGEVVAYVGSTGNAAGGPSHVHFQMHPGGGAAVNPYPSLAKLCVATP